MASNLKGNTEKTGARWRGREGQRTYCKSLEAWLTCLFVCFLLQFKRSRISFATQCVSVLYHSRKLLDTASHMTSAVQKREGCMLPLR